MGKNYNPGAAGAPRQLGDPLAILEARNRKKRVHELATEIGNQTGLEPELAAKMASQGLPLLNALNPFASDRRSMTVGSDQHRLFQAVHAAQKSLDARSVPGAGLNQDPAGNAVRKLLPAAEDSPFLFHNGMAVGPNPAYGKKHGLEWAGDRWAMPKANPNQDLERQALELELERRRRDMEKDDDDPTLEAWLSRRLARKE